MSSTEPTSIVVAGYLTVQANDRDAYLDSCESAIRAARATDGCLDFAISADVVDHTRINVYERWRDRPTLEAFRDQGPDDDQMATLTSIEVGEYEILP